MSDSLENDRSLFALGMGGSLSEDAHSARGVPELFAGDAHLAAPRLERDRALDVVRGLCIVSMCTAHLAAGSLPSQIAHAVVWWTDGAVGFVMLSGVVVGMVQRSTIGRAGLAAGQRKLLRRTGEIYLANLALCLVAFLLVAFDPSRAGPYPSVKALGGGVSAVIATLTLQVNPRYTSILSLFVVLLLLTTGAVAALQRRRVPVLIGASVALYVAGRVWPEVFNLPMQPGVPGAVNWASWQLMFAGALLIGWYWNAPAVRWALASRRMLAAAVVLVAVGAAIGWTVRLGSPDRWRAPVDLMFSEGTLAPGTILLAFAAVLVAYRVCRFLVRVAGPVVSPIGRIGRRSLDCYLILSVTVIVAPSVYRYSRTGLVAVAVTLAVLIVMWGWCLCRDVLAARRTTSDRRTSASLHA